MLYYYRKLQRVHCLLISITATCWKSFWVVSLTRWWILVQITVSFLWTNRFLIDFPYLRFKLVASKCTISGTAFLEGLLANGWLTKLILTCARVETIICKWTLDICTSSTSFFKFLFITEVLANPMLWDLSVLYSPKEDLRSSACDFWCSILLSQNEVLLSIFLLY